MLTQIRHIDVVSRVARPLFSVFICGGTQIKTEKSGLATRD